VYLKSIVHGIELFSRKRFMNCEGVKSFSEKLFMSREGVRLFSKKMFMSCEGVFYFMNENVYPFWTITMLAKMVP